MRLAFMLFVLALPAIALAAPSVSLFSNTPYCGGFNEPECETVYRITIPPIIPIVVTQDNFKMSFRKESDLTLRKELSEVTNIKIYLDGKELNRDSFSETFASGGTYYLRVTGKRQWVFNGVDYETEPIDNVLTAFGHDFTEYRKSVV